MRDGIGPERVAGRTEVTASLSPVISLALDENHAAARGAAPLDETASVNAGAVGRSGTQRKADQLQQELQQELQQPLL